MKSSTIALRDQILAALRAADLPLSTDQVAGAVGRTHPSRPDGFDAGQVVYRNLRALENKGLVRCVRVFQDRRVFWERVPVNVDAVPVVELDEFERVSPDAVHPFPRGQAPPRLRIEPDQQGGAMTPHTSGAYCPDVPGLVCVHGSYADHTRCKGRVLEQIERERESGGARCLV